MSIKKDKYKIIRTSTVPESLKILLKGQLDFLNRYFEIIGISTDGEELKQLAIDEGIKTYGVDMYRRINPFKDIISIYKMYKIIRKEKPLIIHSITPKAGFISMLAGYLAKVPIRIHTFTGLVFPNRKGIFQKILILIDKLICFCATEIIPEGKGVMNDLIKYRITTKNMSVIGNGNINGVNIEYFSEKHFSTSFLHSVKNDLRIKQTDFIYCFVGRVVKEKGIEELVKSFLNLKSQHQSIKLLIIGKFEKELDPISIIVENEILNNPDIKYLGYQSDIRPFILISDVLVLPSYREGFPNVVIQAGALDKPCIVTDINGSNEIIINKVNGLIVPSKNQDELEKSMKLLFQDSELRMSLSKRSRELIVNRFEHNYIWNEILKKYKSLIENVQNNNKDNS